MDSSMTRSASTSCMEGAQGVVRGLDEGVFEGVDVRRIGNDL
jgi:hypothetical protein